MAEQFNTSTMHANFFKENGEKVQFKKGSSITWDRDDTPWVFLVSDGLVRMSLKAESGPPTLIGYLVPGMIFSQPGSHFEPSTDGIIFEAASPCTIHKITLNRLFEVLERNPQLVKEWTWNSLQNEIFFAERIAFQGEKGIKARFIKWLLFMAKYYGETTGDSCKIYIPLTQETIGQFVNATRESINKTISELVRINLISIYKKKITITDIDKLRSMLEDDKNH